MKIKVIFFSEDLVAAIGAGVYKASVIKPDGDSAPLYIGESFSVLIRCATHLFELMRNPGYFGFTPTSIEDARITLKFEMLEQIDDSCERKHREKEIINETLNTQQIICQSGVSDRMKSIDDKVRSLTEFLYGK